ncbi:MAG: transglycosylase family protein [Actinomycetota bacterium]|nr:transglycosylase family protein [Actinomycetota bacterium]
MNATSTTTTEAPTAPVVTITEPATGTTPATTATGSVNHEDESPPLGGSVAGGTFACIREAESGGNYGERGNPRYRGAYQIGFQEWADMGGSGDPADASPAEQDMRAQRLQAARGWAPWATHGMCGV